MWLQKFRKLQQNISKVRKERTKFFKKITRIIGSSSTLKHARITKNTQFDKILEAFCVTNFHTKKCLTSDLILEMPELLTCEPESSNQFEFIYTKNSVTMAKSKKFEDILIKMGFIDELFGVPPIEEIISEGLTGRQKENAVAFARAFSEYYEEIGIENEIGICLILGQVAHESINFSHFAELGHGQGREYGVPAGPYNKIYYGRGPLQVTWYGNYLEIYNKFFKRKLNLPEYDVVQDPDLAVRDPYVGSLLSMGWFLCIGNGKTAVRAANKGKVKSCSKAINGGYNGLEDRQEKTLKYAERMGISLFDIDLNG